MTARGWLGVTLFLLAGALAPGPAVAYEEIEVHEGGTIVGHVLFKGSPALSGTLEVSKDREFCGDRKPDERLVIGPEGGVKNAIVTIEDVPRGKEIDRTVKAHLDNRKCRFVPHVQAVSVGSLLEISNQDGVLHNTHGFLEKRTVFNLALPLQGQAITKKLRRPGLVRVRCDAGHTWMSAYILVSPNPYFAVSDEGGRFKISNVPPGSYRVRAWHEKLGTQVSDVNVGASAVSQVVFSDLRP